MSRLLSIALLGLATSATLGSSNKARVGVYDNRAIAIAFAGSEQMEEWHGELQAALERAREAGDADYARFICQVPISFYDQRIARIGLINKERILDAGCGFGHWTAVLAARNEHVVALERNSSRIGVAREFLHDQGCDNVSFIHGNAEHLPFADGDCGTCHASHSSELEGLLSGPVGLICADCHDVATEAPVGGSAHEPVAAGDCSTCHQPHGSAVAGFLQASARPLCGSCHTEIEHQLTSGQPHMPAEDADGCLTCHSSHTSPQRNLLAQPVDVMCTDCHDGESDQFRGTHLGLTAQAMNCGGCHEPHASQGPGMLLPVQHMGFEDRDCSMCHAEEAQP